MSGKGISCIILLPEDLSFNRGKVHDMIEDFVYALSKETGRSVGVGVGTQNPDLNYIRRLRSG